MTRSSKAFFALCLILLCSACGQRYPWDNSSPDTSTVSAGVTTGQSGRIVQGPVVGASVFADSLVAGSGTRFVADAGEVSATTDANGNFTLPSQPTYSHVIVSKGGTDKLTNQPAIQMLAPAGSTNVSPLTTLVALDTTGLVKAKIESLLPAGAKFDTDISISTSQAALLLSQSVETTVRTMTQAITKDSGSTVSAAQLASLQTQIMKDVSAEIAKPATTTAILSTPSSLSSTVISAAVTASATAINNDNASYSNIDISASAATAAAATVVTAVTTTATQICGSANLNTQANTTTKIAEPSVMTPAAVASITAAVTTAANTISADTGLTATVTPTTFTPPVVAVVVTPMMASVSPAKDAVIVGGTTATISASFTEAMLNSATDAASAANSANWKITAGGANIAISAIAYDATTKTFSATTATALPNGATINVTITRAVKSAAGVALINDISWNFKTAATGTSGGTR